MARAQTDVQIVKAILDEMEGQPKQLKADRIVRVIGPRIRKRARGRAEDFSQAAVREATEEK